MESFKNKKEAYFYMFKNHSVFVVYERFKLKQFK